LVKIRHGDDREICGTLLKEGVYVEQRKN
jgi:hypothetical protein